jgi:hypothetical protein
MGQIELRRTPLWRSSSSGDSRKLRQLLYLIILTFVTLTRRGFS